MVRCGCGGSSLSPSMAPLVTHALSFDPPCDIRRNDMSGGNLRETAMFAYADVSDRNGDNSTHPRILHRESIKNRPEVVINQRVALMTVIRNSCLTTDLGLCRFWRVVCRLRPHRNRHKLTHTKWPPESTIILTAPSFFSLWGALRKKGRRRHTPSFFYLYPLAYPQKQICGFSKSCQAFSET
jgi:hypothetical protein